MQNPGGIEQDPAASIGLSENCSWRSSGMLLEHPGEVTLVCEPAVQVDVGEWTRRLSKEHLRAFDAPTPEKIAGRAAAIAVKDPSQVHGVHSSRLSNLGNP